METRKGVGRETDTKREIETETGSVTQAAQEIDTGIAAVTERKTEKRTEPRTGSGIAGIGTAKEIKMEGVSVAATATETETGTVAGQALSATNKL